VAASAAGILTSVLAQQTPTSAAVAVYSAPTTRVMAAVPAAASPTGDPSGDTHLTFQVGTVGLLSISVPATANIGSVATAGTTSNWTTIGTVTVTDNRTPAGQGWVTSASSTALVSGANTIPAADIEYDPNASSITVTGGITATPTPPSPPITMGSAATVMTGTGGTAIPSIVTWDPELRVNVPVSQANGVYTGTLTHSVT
jgi:hypothetical protein